MATFVFLHGGGMGGWVWRSVAEPLRADGHRVFTPTFTGFGERSHLIGRHVTHDVHVTDIVNTLTYEDAEDVILVAFSYGGTVAPGVAAAVGPRIRRVVYLDGIVPEAGETVAEAMGYLPKDVAAGLDAQLAAGEGPIGSGVDEMQRKAAVEKPYKMPLDRQAWLLAHMSDMPMRCTVSPVTVGAAALGKSVDYCAVPNDVMVPMHARARALGWNVEEIRGDYDHAFIVGYPEVVLNYMKARL
jgi:pimeloyl-ACP methyl ester carboxylesterase